MNVQVSPSQDVESFRYMPRSATAGSYKSSISFEKPPNWLHQFTLTPTVNNGFPVSNYNDVVLEVGKEPIKYTEQNFG